MNSLALTQNPQTAAIATPNKCNLNISCKSCAHSSRCTHPQNQLEPKEFTNFCVNVMSEWGNRCMYPVRLDMYGRGCAHDCKYCYARAIHIRFKRWNPQNPSVANITKIEKKIQTFAPGSFVRLGGMTDCFQPVEMKYRVTLQTIKLLNKYRISYLIVTKSPLVAYPDYLNAMDRNLAHIQISVTSLNQDLKRVLENTRPPDQMIHAYKTLRKEGFDASIRLSPLIEEYMDFDILNSLDIDKCIVEFLRVNNLMRGLPLIDYGKYTYWRKNSHHLPLEEKLRIIDKVKIPSISVCEKIPEHYDHWRDDFNPNKADCCNLCIRPQLKVITTETAKPSNVNNAASEGRQISIT